MKTFSLENLSIRAGIGYDIHPLRKGRKLILAGVEIPYKKGLSGHSDADVVIHSLCDALLGAVAGGDIGEHFPESEKKYRNISSIFFLKEIKKNLKEKKFKILNIDIIIILKEPKITKYKEEMRKKIAQVLDIKISQINIKAKTNQGIGIFKESQAVACFSLVLLRK